jgi:hypothetical protein
MTEENTVEQTAAVDQSAAPEAPAADLNISDLLAVKSIIEISSQRGAFKANELEGVGKIYNKLSNFLEAVTKKENK